MEEESDLFNRAAILAQHPEAFEDHAELTEDDKYHLRRETTHKWSQPATLCACSFLDSKLEHNR